MTDENLPKSEYASVCRLPQRVQTTLLRLCAHSRGPPQAGQSHGARGRQLAHRHCGQRPYRQNRTQTPAWRTRTSEPQAGPSRRQGTRG